VENDPEIENDQEEFLLLSEKVLVVIQSHHLINKEIIEYCIALCDKSSI
jgi:hypothetical protein